MQPQMNAGISFVFPAIALSLLSLTIAPAIADEDPFLNESRALAESFGVELQTALKAGLEKGGPVEAVTVCKDLAPQIAARLSRESGAKVSRTSTRFRNPANAPEPWQAAWLERFQSDITTGVALPEQIERHAGGTRYMKAIRMQPVCLACHGEKLSGDVSAALAEYYPHDRARGYSVGDLRGAFSISWPAVARQAQPLPPISAPPRVRVPSETSKVSTTERKIINSRLIVY